MYQKHININNVHKYCRLILGAYEECMDSFHAFLNNSNQKKKLTTLITTTTASPTSKLTTTTPKRNPAIHEAIRQWASFQVLRHLDKKSKKMNHTNLSTTTQMTTTISSVMTTTNPKSSTKGKNLAFHHALRPIREEI